MELIKRIGPEVTKGGISEGQLTLPTATMKPYREEFPNPFAQPPKSQLEQLAPPSDKLLSLPSIRVLIRRGLHRCWDNGNSKNRRL